MAEPRTKSETADQTWYKRYPRDEAAETTVLTCEEYGVLQRFRDYSLIHGGIENDVKLLIRIGRTFQLSKYKLEKLWSVCENFFTLRDGRFFYEADEMERSALFVISCKRSLAGKLGATARWSDRNAAASNGQNLPMANAIDVPSGLPSKNRGELEVEADTTTGGSAAAASTMGPGEAAAAGPPPGNTTATKPPPGQELTNPHDEPQREAFLAVSERCTQLGMPVPSPDLAWQIVKKFPDYPAREVAASLPRWPDQNSAALWLSKSADEIRLEAQRQQDSPGATSGKPTARDEHNRAMMERAHGLDRDRRKKAGT